MFLVCGERDSSAQSERSAQPWCRLPRRQEPRRVVGDDHPRDVARVIESKADLPLRREARQQQHRGTGKVADAELREVDLRHAWTAQVVRRCEDALGARVVIRIRGAQLLEPARIEINGLVEDLRWYVTGRHGLDGACRQRGCAGCCHGRRGKLASHGERSALRPRTAALSIDYAHREAVPKDHLFQSPSSACSRMWSSRSPRGGILSSVHPKKGTTQRSATAQWSLRLKTVTPP